MPVYIKANTCIYSDSMPTSYAAYGCFIMCCLP